MSINGTPIPVEVVRPRKTFEKEDWPEFVVRVIGKAADLAICAWVLSVVASHFSFDLGWWDSVLLIVAVRFIIPGAATVDTYRLWTREAKR